MTCQKEICYFFDRCCINNCKLFKSMNDAPQQCREVEQTKDIIESGVIKFEHKERKHAPQINQESKKIELTLDYFNGAKIREICFRENKTQECIRYIIKQVKARYLGIRSKKVGDILKSPRLKDHIDTLERDLAQLAPDLNDFFDKQKQKVKELEELK